MNRLATRSLAGRPTHAPQEVWRVQQIIDRAALAYMLVIASGALGIFDIVQYGVTPGGRILGISPINRVVWPAAYLLFAWLTLRRWPDVLDAAIRTWWVLLVPAVAILSLLWSIDPVTSANGALRLTVTAVIGLYLGVAFGLPEIARAVFWVLMAIVGLSVLAVALGLDVAVMFDGKARGIFYHKNQLGNRAVILIAAALTLSIVERRHLLAAVGVVLGVAALALARSATSGIAVAAVFAAAPLLLALRGQPLGVALRCALLGAALTAGALGVVMSGIEPMTAVLDLLDRDTTLTGRSWLWEAATAQIERRPLLGTGLDAFWTAAVDWRTLEVLERLGEVGDFHNTYLEIWVQLGLIGLIAALMTLSIFAWRATRLFLRSDDLSGFWWLAFGLAVIVPSVAEYELFKKHSFTGILFVAIAVAGSRALELEGRGAATARTRTSPTR